MKYSQYLLLLSLLLVVLSACDPISSREEMQTSPRPDELKFTVTQEEEYDNTVYLSSETPETIVFWDYAVGTSNQLQDTVLIPFAGDYTIKYTAYTGGIPVSDSVQISVSENDPVYFSDPEWDRLTNGEAGKIWVLNMEKPVGWYGTTYGESGEDDWVWHPDYAGNEWVMENKDWGEMTFDLNGDTNYQSITFDDNEEPVTCTGTFTMNLEEGMIQLNGCDLLYGGNYYNDASNWRSIKIIELTDDTLILGVFRDQSDEGEAWIGFQFEEKS